MKTEFVILAAPIIWLGVADGLLPIWIGIMTMLFATIISGTSILRLLRGGGFDDGPMPSYEKVASEWINSTYQRELARVPKRQTWNCKNCGGPNIDQIKCEYCGMVKE